MPVCNDFIDLGVAELDDDIEDFSHISVIVEYLVANAGTRQSQHQAHSNNETKLFKS